MSGSRSSNHNSIIIPTTDSLSPIIDWLIDTNTKIHLCFTLIKPFLDSQLETYHDTKKWVLFTKILMRDILDL